MQNIKVNVKEMLKLNILNRGMRCLVQASFKDIDVVDYQIEMINHNEDSSLLTMEKFLLNDEIQINYDITNLISLRTYLKENTLNKMQLLNILLNMCNAIIDSEKYYLNNKNFLLSEQYVFVNKDNTKLSFIYLPLDEEYSNDINEDFKTLVKKIIIDLAIVEDSVVDNYLQIILNEIKKDEFTINQFRNIILQIQNGSNINLQKNRVNESELIIKEVKNVNKNSVNKFQNQTNMNKENVVKPNINTIPNVQNINNNTSYMNSNPQNVNNELRQNNVKDNNFNVNQNTTNNNFNTMNKNMNNNMNNNGNKNQIEYETKSVYAPIRIALTAVTQVLVLAIVICVFLFSNNMDITQKCALVVATVAIDIIICRNLLNKEKKVNVRVKVKNNSINNSTNNFNNNSNNNYNHQNKNNNFFEENNAIVENIYKAKVESNINQKKMLENNSISYETTLLGLESPYFKLSIGGVAERIDISKENFVIGRIDNMVDYVIKNNAVGKRHVQIITKGNSYYIKDLESKNGTYINGKKLSPNQEYLLNDNDEVTLANVTMQFRIS